MGRWSVVLLLVPLVSSALVWAQPTQPRVTERIEVHHVHAPWLAALFGADVADARPPPGFYGYLPLGIEALCPIQVHFFSECLRGRTPERMRPGHDVRQGLPVIGLLENTADLGPSYGPGLQQVLPPSIRTVHGEEGVLAVTGTREDVDAFRELVAVLDVPLKRLRLTLTAGAVPNGPLAVLPEEFGRRYQGGEDGRGALSLRLPTHLVRDLAWRQPGPVRVTLTALDNVALVIRYGLLLPGEGQRLTFTGDEVRLLCRVNADDSVTVHIGAVSVGPTPRGAVSTIVRVRQDEAALWWHADQAPRLLAVSAEIVRAENGD